jgi:lysozyme
MELKADKAGLDFIKSFEGLHDGDKTTPILEPQMDPIGIWTLGWGYALFASKRPLTGERDRVQAHALWRELYPGGMTLGDADALLAVTVGKTAAKLGPLIKVRLSQGQANALISLAYNVGIGIADGRKGDLADSSLLAALNAGKTTQAANHFRDWKFAGGKIVNGLVRRREAERALFLKGA